jgi:hypothetical protein
VVPVVHVKSDDRDKLERAPISDKMALLRWSQIRHNAGSPRVWSCVRTQQDGRLRAAQIAHLMSRGRPEGGAPPQCNGAVLR